MTERKNMDILKQVDEILKQQNPQKKDTLLSELDDVLEYRHDLSEASVVDGVQLLLTAALQEDDRRMRQKFFRTIDTAVACQDIGDRVDWDGLVPIPPALGKWELEYVLGVLGLSGQERYLTILEEYTHHADSEISKWAQEAIVEIKYRVEHASDSHREAV
jgi:hypothetical protein